MHAERLPKTDPELLLVLDELSPREPIFHRPEFASNLVSYGRMMADDYWEFGASGRLYDRDYIIEMLAKTPPVDAAVANWWTSDFHCRRLADDTYLLTYTLDQAGRTTRRSTIWRSTAEGWQILFHQGTVVQNA
jgi:hypothetical protein